MRGEPITAVRDQTAAAFLLFARHPADVLLLEVGLGGRLDATNVSSGRWRASSRRSSIDHAEFLGDTLDADRRPRRPASSSAACRRSWRRSRREALAVHRAPGGAGARRRCMSPARTGIAIEEHGRLVYQDERGLLDLPPPKLFGRHQFDNAGTAIAALRARRHRSASPTTAIEQRRCTSAEWPARMQRLTPGRLAAIARRAAPSSGSTAGTMPTAGGPWPAALGDLEERVSRPLVLVVGMLGNKDAQGFLRNFAGLARRVIAVPIPIRRSAMPCRRSWRTRRARRHSAPRRAASVEAALRRSAGSATNPPPRILITGSLYLAGEVLAANGTPPN